jgi:cytochrome P450
MACPLAQVPVYPKPAPYKKHFVWRLFKGLHSWLGLLSDVDFRIPIGSVQFRGLHLVLLNEPQAVKRVLVEEVEEFPKHPFTLWILEPLIGRAIFSVNGAEWARQRRLLDQAFQAAQLRRVLPQMRGAVEALLERLDRQLEGGGDPDAPVSIEIDAEMTQVTADVIMRTILSRPLQGDEAAGIFRAFARYQRRAGQALMLRFLRLSERRLQAYLGRHASTIRSWIGAAIETRLGGDAPSEMPPQDLLQALLEARDPDTGTGFSSEELVDQVCFLFLAGHETSASALGMAVYLLGCFPEVQQRLRAEVLQVLGSRAGAPERPLGFEDLRGLAYGAAVFNETLRLYPPVSFFIREAQGDMELAGSGCPMRSLVALSPWVIQRHEQHWSEPNAFRPERFLSDANADDRRWARDAFLPYGLGPRKCPGAAFALQEALLVLAELVRRYELLPDPGPAPDLVGRLTLRSRNGIRVRLRRLRS